MENQLTIVFNEHSHEEFCPQVIRHEATRRIREYWASKKREERARKRKNNPSNDAVVYSVEYMTKVCKKIVRCWQDATKGMDLDGQKQIFSQLLQHPAFHVLQPSAFGIERSIMCNIQNTLNQVKVPRSSEELKLKRAACMMVLNSEGERSRIARHSQVAKFFGLHRRNFVAANLRLQQSNDGALPLQLCQRRRPQSSTITTEIKELVFDFWRSETRVSPNKKDVCRKRLGRKIYTRHPVHLLDEPQVELYKRFREEHPEVGISLRCFEGLKPYFVRKLRDRYTCCCIYHVQMIFLKEALNTLRQSKAGVHGASCNCRCSLCMSDVASLTTCQAANHTYTSVTTLWESLLCRKAADASFHSKACLKGQCTQCGSKKLTCCPKEVSTNSFQVTVKVFEDVTYGNNDEETGTKKHKDVVIKKMGCKDFRSLLESHITTFVRHNYFARWQAQQFKDCLSRFPSDVVVSVIDFAENYTFKEQNEIQSMHWFSSQVTILVQITYVRPMSEVQKFVHFYISDDKVHDTLFVQHCLCLHSTWLKDQGLNFLKRHWVWSDGCAAQFKSKRPFFFVSRYYQLTGLEMMWNYFASGHGKGEHDGAGAVIKRTLTHEQLKPNGWPMKCAADIVAFLKQHSFSNTDKQCTVNRIYWEIKENEVPRERMWNCKRLKGSREMHCVNGHSSTDRCAFRWRSLSCFCDFCMSQRWRRCLNTAHVEEWSYISIQPLEVEGIDSDEESDDEGAGMPMYGGHHDAISDALRVGDNFATNPSEEGWDFYILKCSKEKHRAIKALQDSWGNCVSAGSYFVEGYYYEKVDGKDDVYHIPAGQPHVIIASHLVRSIKFQMEPMPENANWFKMSSEVYEHIYNSMPFEFQ